jgi:energy-converting hydrogenase Eha subunit F
LAVIVAPKVAPLVFEVAVEIVVFLGFLVALTLTRDELQQQSVKLCLTHALDLFIRPRAEIGDPIGEI